MASIGSHKITSLPNVGTLTFKVYLSRRMRFRFWLGTKLLILGGRCLCCDVEVEDLRRPL